MCVCFRYAYSWEDASDRGTLPSIQLIPPSAAPDKVPFREGKRAYARVETLPGIDQFVGDLRGLREKSLQPLLVWAEAVIPKACQRTIPLFFFATAGSRGLSSAEQEEVLKQVQSILSKSVFW